VLTPSITNPAIVSFLLPILSAANPAMTAKKPVQTRCKILPTELAESNSAASSAGVLGS